MGSIGPQFGVAPLLLNQVALDNLFEEMAVGKVDVIKLDVEGAELGALQGMTRLLDASPTVVFEFTDWAEGRIDGQVPGAAQAFLQSIGYHTFYLERKGEAGAALEQPLRKGSAMLLSQRAADS